MFEVVQSDMSHVRELSRDLRDEDRQEVEAMGIKPSHALFHSFKRSIMRRTALLDGKVIAMWGVAGTPLSLVGHPYLLTGNYFTNLSPLKFIRTYKLEVEYMKQLFPVLENYVDASYKGAIRVLELVGFKLDEPILVGPRNTPFRRFSMVTE